MTPLDQLRLPTHEFGLLMQAVKPVAEADRDALIKGLAAELGQHEVIGPGLLHRIIGEVQRRYGFAERHTPAEKREDPGMDVRGSAGRLQVTELPVAADVVWSKEALSPELVHKRRPT